MPFNRTSINPRHYRESICNLRKCLARNPCDRYADTVLAIKSTLFFQIPRRARSKTRLIKKRIIESITSVGVVNYIVVGLFPNVASGESPFLLNIRSFGHRHCRLCAFLRFRSESSRYDENTKFSVSSVSCSMILAKKIVDSEGDFTVIERLALSLHTKRKILHRFPR